MTPDQPIADVELDHIERVYNEGRYDDFRAAIWDRFPAILSAAHRDLAECKEKLAEAEAAISSVLLAFQDVYWNHRLQKLWHKDDCNVRTLDEPARCQCGYSELKCALSTDGFRALANRMKLLEAAAQLMVDSYEGASGLMMGDNKMLMRRVYESSKAALDAAKVTPAPNVGHMAKVFGKLPGDETDEEINEGLK